MINNGKKLLRVLLITTIISLPVFGELIAPYFGIFTGVQGLTYIPAEGNPKGGSDFGLINGIELMFGRKVYFYGHGYVFIPNSLFTSFSPKYFSTLAFNYGLGVGYRIFDDRIDGQGNSFNINFTASVIDMKPYTNDSYVHYDNKTKVYIQSSRSLHVGGEVFANYYYSVFKNFTLRAGLNFGTFATIWTDRKQYAKLADAKDTEFETYFGGITVTYGLSIGIAF